MSSTDLGKLEDEALMQRFSAGHGAAFELLYGRHKGPLFRYMLRATNDRDTAEELYQDAWMRVIDHRGSYKPSARFTTWLYTIARNRLIDHYRKSGRMHEFNGADEGPGDPPDPEQIAADPLHEPENEAANNRLAQMLIDCLAKLPGVQREAFLLKEEAGLSLAEIAEACGLNREAVKSRLRYAVEKLRHCLWRMR